MTFPAPALPSVPARNTTQEKAVQEEGYGMLGQRYADAEKG